MITIVYVILTLSTFYWMVSIYLCITKNLPDCHVLISSLFIAIMGLIIEIYKQYPSGWKFCQ